MTDAMLFNINDTVRVKLTDEGRKAHRENFDKLYCSNPNKPEYRPIKEDDDGWSSWQMWYLMQQFGPHTYMGCELMFHPTIELPKDKLKEPQS